MSANPTASVYLLLFRHNAWYQDLAPEVIEASMNRFTAWADQLSREGKLKSGGPLETSGKTLTGRNMVIDGPFAESKEAVAGFFVIQAARSMRGARSPILRRSRFAKFHVDLFRTERAESPF
jgi:hypothetical protein